MNMFYLDFITGNIFQRSKTECTLSSSNRRLYEEEKSEYVTKTHSNYRLFKWWNEHLIISRSVVDVEVCCFWAVASLKNKNKSKNLCPLLLNGYISSELLQAIEFILKWLTPLFRMLGVLLLFQFHTFFLKVLENYFLLECKAWKFYYLQYVFL